MRGMWRGKTGLVLALLLALGGAADAAKKKKAKAPRLDPVAERHMAEGLGSLEKGEWSSAISHFNKAVRKQGTVSSYFLLGWAHYQRGFKLGSPEAADRDDAQSAIDAYNMALAQDPALETLPDPSRLYFSLALCHEAVESYDRALAAYKSALRASPDKVLIPMHAARLRLKMGDPDKAMSNIEMAMSKARKNGVEDALRRQVHRDPAFAKLVASAMHRRAIGISSPDEDGTMVAADFRGETMRDAIRDTPARPAPPPQDPAALDAIARGNLEFKFRRFGAAIGAYHEALAINQESGSLAAAQIAQIYEKIGTSYNKLGQSDQAARTLQRALQQDPTSAAAHYQLALAYAMSGKTGASLRALDECFRSASGPALRRYVIMAKTDSELEAVRDLPGYHSLLSGVSERIALR